MSKELQRTCPNCGNEFSGAMEFCPVCVLRKALAAGVQSSGVVFCSRGDGQAYNFGTGASPI